MLSDIKEILKSKLLLSPDKIEMIENGPGFRINDHGFVCEKIGDFSWKSECKELDLCALMTIRQERETFVISNQIINTGPSTLKQIDKLEPLSIVFDQSCDKWRHIFLAGGTEEGCYPPGAFKKTDRVFDNKPLKIESPPDGRSSNLHLPILMSLFDGDEKSEGLYCAMEWSGLWYMIFEDIEKNKSRLSAGIKVNGLSLEPNEILKLPDVHIGFFQGGADEGSNALRKYIYTDISARYKGKKVIPPVSYNHWMSELSCTVTKTQIKKAAELGMEVCIIDAGWFEGDFPYGVGNWDKIDHNRFPDGLEPIAGYVKELGMEFGLWFEPERASEETSVLKEHPEWFFPGGQGRSYHLNLAIKEAQDYLIEMMGKYISKLDLKWIKWDYNISPFKYWKAQDDTYKIQFGYFDGLYKVLDTLLDNHPDLRIECCASGGRRMDFGTLKRAHTSWISDAYYFEHNFILSRYMQARANYFLPGQLLLTWVTVDPEQEKIELNDTAIISRMIGTLGFNGNIADLDEKQTELLKYWISEYKQIRHLVVQKFFQLLPSPESIEDWDAVQYINHESTESVLFVFAGNKGGSKNITVNGLDPDRVYTVKKSADGNENNFPGKKLSEDGLKISLKAFEGGLWRIEQID